MEECPAVLLAVCAMLAADAGLFEGGGFAEAGRAGPPLTTDSAVLLALLG